MYFAPVVRRAIRGAPFMLAIASAAVACASNAGSGPSSFGSVLMTKASDAGAYAIDVRASPSPVVHGVDVFQLTIKDPSGAPVTGLAVHCLPWMPTMGHGTSVNPTVIEKGQGVYELDNVDLFMAGTWELRLTLDGATEDKATLSFEVP